MYGLLAVCVIFPGSVDVDGFCIVCTVFFVLFRLCIFILICFVSTSARTTATEWQLQLVVVIIIIVKHRS